MQTGSLVVRGKRLEFSHTRAPRRSGPTLVLLHEGLGCVAMWKDFPALLHARTGLPVLAYTRAGYAGSDAAQLPRSMDYMHREALDVLPDVLDAAGIDRAVLVGHSDGASIALVYAGGVEDGKACGLVLMAPHVFCEPESVAGVRAAGEAFARGGLRARLARYHGEQVDAAFAGWHDAWTDPRFLAFDIAKYLGAVRVPVLVLQGLQDEYGTLAQLDAIDAGVRGPVTRVELAGVGHSPFRERPEETLSHVADFLEQRVAPVASTAR